MIGQLLIGMVAIQAEVPPGPSGLGSTPSPKGLHVVSRRWHIQMRQMHPLALALQLLLQKGTQVAALPPGGPMEWYIL